MLSCDLYRFLPLSVVLIVEDDCGKDAVQNLLSLLVSCRGFLRVVGVNEDDGFYYLPLKRHVRRGGFTGGTRLEEDDLVGNLKEELSLSLYEGPGTCA